MNNSTLVSKYGPWAIITGASSGLGAEFAEQLAGAGLQLILVARREDRLRSLAGRLEKKYGISTRVIALDLTVPDVHQVLLERTQELEVGLLINNAGFSRTGPLLESSTIDERNMFRVNCEVPLQLAMEFGKQMAARGRGGIIFVSSSVAFAPVPYWTHYSATKAYSLYLGEGLHYELKKSGVDVLSLCPGGMKTEFQAIAGISDQGAMDVKTVAVCALKSLGRKSSVVPGWHIAAVFKLLPKLLPRRATLSLFGFMMLKLAGKPTPGQKDVQ